MGNLVINVLKVNILAGIFIYLVVLVSYVVQRRYSARWRYVMWLLISLFLLFPVNPFSNKALIQLEIPQRETSDTWNQGRENTERTGEGIQYTDAAGGGGTNPAAANAEMNGVNMADPGAAGLDPGDLSAAPQGSKDTVRKLFAWNVRDVLNGIFIIWMSGIVCVMIFRAASYQFMMRKLKRWAFYIRDKRIRRIYRLTCREKHVKHPPKLMKNAEIGSPLLAGLGQTYLFLPEREYTDNELKLVFSHELTHYKHKDLWYKLFLLIIRTIYWFNPYLYLMGREAEKDVEYICDSSVVMNCTRSMRSLYQRLLVSTAAISGSTPCLSASLNDSMKTFKERLLYMTKAKHMKKGIVPVLVLSVLLVFSNGLVGCSVKEKSSDESQTADADELLDDEQDKVIDEEENAADGEIRENPAEEENQQKDTANAQAGTSAGDEVDSGKNKQTEDNGVSLQEAENPVSANESADQGDGSVESVKELESEETGVKAKVKMHAGTYFDEIIYTWASGEAESSPYCEFDISNVTDTSFDFAIYQRESDTSGRSLIFKKHTAVFTGDGMEAVYNGEQYTIRFSFPDERQAFPDVVDMKVSGFGPVEGATFVNNGIPGHEFG